MGDKIPYIQKMKEGSTENWSAYYAKRNEYFPTTEIASEIEESPIEVIAPTASETSAPTAASTYSWADFDRDLETPSIVSTAASIPKISSTSTASTTQTTTPTTTVTSTSNLTSSSGPRGRRNNNWGNIRKSKDQWQGKTGDDGAFVIFDTPESGVRASRVLITNYIKNGYNTIQKIISRWAPAADNNNPNGYIQRVVQRSGIDKDKVITANDMDAIKKILTAMYEVELGQTLSANDLAVVDRGMKL